MAERIQLRRTKGWRKPESAIVVARPSKWGNPFVLDRCCVHGVGWVLTFDSHNAARVHSITMFEKLVRGLWNPGLAEPLTDSQYRDLGEGIQKWRRRIGGHPTEAARSELGGHDLACWCPLDQPCHADVLLELANA